LARGFSSFSPNDVFEFWARGFGPRTGRTYMDTTYQFSMLLAEKIIPILGGKHLKKKLHTYTTSQ